MGDSGRGDGTKGRLMAGRDSEGLNAGSGNGGNNGISFDERVDKGIAGEVESLGDAGADRVVGRTA